MGKASMPSERGAEQEKNSPENEWPKRKSQHQRQRTQFDQGPPIRMMLKRLVDVQ
jgi:hypothetical protein